MTAYTKMFDTEEIQVICQEYLSGMSPQEIADKHYCSRPTIRNYLTRAGIQLRNYHGSIRKAFNRYPTAMILHDWQSGMKADMIVRIYKLKNNDCLYSFVKRMRKNGYKFDRR
jgi:uncharacterized protein (DUF433 family)